MNTNIIAHLADIHIRLNSRFDEYKAVLEKTIEELKQVKPRRIVIAGDLFHIKINMTPKSTSIAGYFIKELAKIAPVDIILGNHDMNDGCCGCYGRPHLCELSRWVMDIVSPPTHRRRMRSWRR